MSLKDEIARIVYEGTRIEAEWSNRPIVPEPWEQRDEAFRNQFVKIIEDYLSREVLPTPEEAHNSWMASYFAMGWVYGHQRDVEKKTHPDLIPFNQLSQSERDKDAIFLAFVWEMKQILALIEGQKKCPYPIQGDDGTVRDCVEKGHCGCDEVKE